MSTRSYRSTSQDDSPYAKPYHSYRTSDRRRQEDSSSVSSQRSLLDRSRNLSTSPMKATGERRTSGQTSPIKIDMKVLKKSERKYSSGGGDNPEILTRNQHSVERTLKMDEVGDDSNGLPSSTDANVSEASVENDKTASESESVSSSSAKLQNVLKNMPNKGSARKGFLRGMVATEQHNQQTRILNAFRASSSQEAEDIKSRKVIKITNPSQLQTVELTSPEELSNQASQSSTTSPSKRKRRYYKGGTYGLYLSKKKSKKGVNKKDSETDDHANQEGEESRQSSQVNSESDGEENGQADEDRDSISSGGSKGFDDNDKIEDFSADAGLRTDNEEATPNEHLEKEPFSTEKVEKNLAALSKKPQDDQGSQSSIIDSVKSRPRRRRIGESEELEYKSPSKQKPEISGKTVSLLQNSEKPTESEHLTSAPLVYHFYSNGQLNSDDNVKTILKMSTAGSVNSENINGSYSGVEQKRFVVINDPKMAPLSSCCCTDKPLGSATEFSKGKPMFCQALDCFDEKLIGCCNQARLTSLFRASKRLPFRVLCEVHLARLRRHHCCPGCGLFCTQGEFLECFTVKKQVHLFHKRCQIEQPRDAKTQKCLHCANVSPLKVVRLEMNGPVNNTYYLQQTTVLKSPRAKITISKKKGKVIEETKDFEIEEPGITFVIPETKKTLSLVGLGLCPQRKQLEELLSALSVDKLSIRFTNKNFYSVAKSGDIEKVLSLLAQGMDPNYTYEDNNNETPLHAAAASGHLAVVHLLIQAGANPNVLNKNMTTPLMQAIEFKSNAVVKYLINVGAKLEIRGEDGMTALHIATKAGNIEAVHYILEIGKININSQDDGGWTPLVWGTEHKHYNIVKMLVNKGADPNIQDDEENAGLHWAAFSGEANIAHMFLEMDCEINRTNIHGDTPLHVAARRDNYDCVVLLLSRGADLSLLNKNNETALHCCTKNSQTEMALKINQEIRKFSAKRTLCSERILHRDLSKGKEFYQLQVVNGVDDEPYPIDFMYVTENCETSAINIDRTISSLQSCQCEDDCTSQRCICAAISFRCWYDKDGRLLPEFNLNDAPMIFECNRACACWKTCNNRVVQLGVRTRLQVFRTKGKGWGVRTLKDIPRGTFVCEYVGEIITDSEADRREDDSYLFDLDNKDGETYCLDARFFGNICRFINHLCSPNLVPVKVFVDHQDLSFPRIALFSSRDIKAYEELGFDYGEKFWVIKYKWFTCFCGSQNCKYNKETIQKTLDNYYKRIRDEQARDSLNSTVAQIID